jgi:hypothetical protein
VRRTLSALILLAALAPPGIAQVGVGVTVSYSAGFALEMETSSMGYQYPVPLFWGVTLRYKPSALLIDSGVSVWELGGLSYGYLDLGLCVDVWVFRIALCGGVDAIIFSPSNSLDDSTLPVYYAAGFNGKVIIELKIGDATVGLSAGIPVDTLVNGLRNNGLSGGIHDGLRIVTAQASLSLVYWFGGTESSRRDHHH